MSTAKNKLELLHIEAYATLILLGAMVNEALNNQAISEKRKNKLAYSFNLASARVWRRWQIAYGRK